MGSPFFNRILNCQNLPTLPTVAVEVLEKTRDPDVSIHEISRLVQADQGLSAKILRTVNSSFFGLSQPCSSIDRAIGYLGLKAIKSLVLGFSMVKATCTIPEENCGFDLKNYWRRTTCSAAAARQVAIATNQYDPDEAFTVALFQDMGMLAAYVALGEVYNRVLRIMARERHCILHVTEREELDFDHQEVGSALAEKWQMPRNVIQGLKYHHEPEKCEEQDRQLLYVIAMGRLIAESITGTETAAVISEMHEKMPLWFNQSAELVEPLIKSTTAATRELADLLDREIGELPDPDELLSSANEQLAIQQAMAARENEKLEARAQQLESQARTDALTGIANRKRFDYHAAHVFKQSLAERKPMAVLFLDADRFKSVNDTHGHQAGDAILVELARRLKENCQPNAVPCRYGGEEFAIVMSDTNLFEAYGFAEQCRRSIESPTFDLRGIDCKPDELPITASIGVSAWLPHRDAQATTLDQLVKQADDAVYAAKKEGRNRVCVYGCTVEELLGQSAETEMPVSPSSDEIGEVEQSRLVQIADTPVPDDVADDFDRLDAQLDLLMDVTPEPEQINPVTMDVEETGGDIQPSVSVADEEVSNEAIAQPAQIESDQTAFEAEVRVKAVEKAQTDSEKAMSPQVKPSRIESADRPQATQREVAASQPPRQAQTPVKPSQNRVLVIESDALSASLLRFVFVQHQALVHVISNGNDALDHLALVHDQPLQRPTLIICEQELSDFTGQSLVRLMRRHEGLQDVPVAIMTSGSDTTFPMEAADEAISYYRKCDVAQDIRQWVQAMLCITPYDQAAA